MVQVAGLLQNVWVALYLKAKNFSLLRRWRLKQEKKLFLKSKNKKNLKIMNKNEVLNFMMTYQRITEQMFKTATKFSSIVMTLNNRHQIINIKIADIYIRFILNNN